MFSPPPGVKVHELSTSTIWFDKDGILWSVSKNVPGQSLEESRKTLEEFVKVTGGKKVCLLADVTYSPETSRETREWAAEELPKIVKAVAMVSGSVLGKMLANLFFTLKTQPYPSRMFNSVEEAHAWLKQYL